MSKSQSRLYGFSLIELLVVIAILGVLIAIALPVLAAMRDRGRSAQCMSNLRQIGVVTYAIVDENKGNWPFWVSNMPSSPPVGRKSLTEVYGGHKTSPACFRCPADPTARQTTAADYTSYRYWPGEEMQDDLYKGTAAAIREVSLRMRIGRGSFLWDRNDWHGGGRVSHACFVPDGHVAIK